MCLSRTLLHAYLALSWILLPGNEAAPNAAPFPPPLRPSPRPSQYGDGSAPLHPFDSRFTVEVYDCSMPRSFTPVRTPPAYDKCDQARMPPATRQTNSSYLVLQKAVYQRTRAKRCIVRESTLPLYCGNWDHQTLAAPMVQLFHEVPVTPQECKDMWRKRVWTDNRDGDHPLKVGDTNHIFYTSVGQTVVEQNEVSCVGGRAMWRGNAYHDLVISNYRDITLEHVDLNIDDAGTVLVFQNQVTLPNPECHVAALSCAANTGTYVWRPATVDQSCALYSTRNTTGITVVTATNDHVYMSNDGSMIRLLIKDKQQHCFGWVYATDHSNIFVTTDSNNHFFNRPLDKQEMSFTTYSNAKDSYILGTLGPQIRGELARFLQNDCARTQKLDETHYGARAAEQSASLNGATTRLRGNWFTTAAGDAWYRYRCRGIKAFARADNACYDSLPITLSSEDLLDYARNRNVSIAVAHDTKFFMEPHTHILSTRGIRMDCQETFAALYRGSNGSWIRQAPRLTLVPPPRMLEPKINQVPAHEEEFLYVSEGGIYTAENVRAWEKHMQAPRAYQDVMVQLGRNAISSDWASGDNDDLRPGHILDGVAPPSMLSWLFDLFTTYGNVSAAFFSLFLIARLGMWVVGVFLRIFGPDQRQRGFMQRILGAALPAFNDWFNGVARQNRQVARARQREQERLEQDQLELAHFRLQANRIPTRLLPAEQAALQTRPLPLNPAYPAVRYTVAARRRNFLPRGEGPPYYGTYTGDSLHIYESAQRELRSGSALSGASSGLHPKKRRRGERQSDTSSNQMMRVSTPNAERTPAARRRTTTPIRSYADVPLDKLLEGMREIRGNPDLNVEQRHALEAFARTAQQIQEAVSALTVDSDHSEWDHLRDRAASLRRSILERPDIFPVEEELPTRIHYPDLDDQPDE